MKIIIIEDQDYWRSQAMRVAKEKYPSAQIFLPVSFSETKEILKDHKFDIVVLDGNLWEGKRWGEIKEEVRNALSPGSKVFSFSSDAGIWEEMMRAYLGDCEFVENTQKEISRLRNLL